MTSERNYIFFILGIHSGLRVSDLLTLTVGHVRGQTHIVLVEQKTRNTKKKNKRKKFIIHPDIQDDLNRYIKGKKDHEYLFPSRQVKKLSGARGEPFDRSTAYKMLSEVAARFGLSEIGCHTMRKTWGYHLFMDDPTNLALLMEMFGHTAQTTTLRYLGITQDAMDLAIMRLSYTQSAKSRTQLIS